MNFHECYRLQSWTTCWLWTSARLMHGMRIVSDCNNCSFGLFKISLNHIPNRSIHCLLHFSLAVAKLEMKIFATFLILCMTLILVVMLNIFVSINALPSPFPTPLILLMLLLCCVLESPSSVLSFIMLPRLEVLLVLLVS